VFARPRVALLSTGNEIVDPGRPLGPGQIYDVNTFTLGAIIR
jgi:molybdopterin biosynthesis enzyme